MSVSLQTKFRQGTFHRESVSTMQGLHSLIYMRCVLCKKDLKENIGRLKNNFLDLFMHEKCWKRLRNSLKISDEKKEEIKEKILKLIEDDKNK